MASTEPAQGKPGSKPTVLHVAKFLGAAGFQLSRYTGRMGDRPAGAQTSKSGIRDSVAVYWNEDFDSAEKRLRKLGLDNFGELPAHPEDDRRVRDYAEALSARYHVEIHPPVTKYSSTHLVVTARETLPVRPKGLPSAAAVTRALRVPGARWKLHVVDQHDHIRVAIDYDEGLAPTREALAANGWTFEDGPEAVEHYVIKVTGAAPDRRARLRKLRTERERRAAVDVDPQPTSDQWAPQEGECAPLGSYVAWAEGPQERTEFGHVVGQREGDALVMGLDGGLRQMPADIPEQEPEPLPEPTPHMYDRRGRRWQQGQRAEFKTPDLFLYSGVITGFDERDGERFALIRVDTRRAAPAGRPLYKGAPNLPGKPRQVSPAEDWARPLDVLKPL